MKKIVPILVLFVFVISLVGCSQTDAEKTTQNNTAQEKSHQSEIDKKVADFKERYNAIDFDTSVEGCAFSVDKVDMCKNKNLFSPISYIDDVFYYENDMFLYAETWDDEKFLLKITSEQYSKIKTFDNDSTSAFNLYIVFSLENIEPMLPSLDAYFSFDISSHEDIWSDYDISSSFDTKIIKGTLVDISEIK